MKNKTLINFILVPLILGMIVGVLTTVNSHIDSKIPSYIFPIVWTILYILMGYSSYKIYEDVGYIPKIYAIQLIVNLLWCVIFFKLKLFGLAFLWIIFLMVLVGIMIVKFIRINKVAGYLQIPYLIWLGIALVLNYSFL